jgi:Sulphur oxidation protein SoxZ
MARILINVPPKAKRGDVIEIKTLISHDMESGYRPDNVGKTIPRDIISLFVATYNGAEYSAPSSILRSPPIRFCRSPRSRPRAAE